MKNKPKIKRIKGVKAGTIRGPYNKTVDHTGYTPLERLNIAKAEAQEFENLREREHWQTRESAEAAAMETAEIIQGDLYGTIPLALSGKLSGRVFTPQEVRVIVRSEIDFAVKSWVKGERVSELAIVIDDKPKGKKK
jgi:hypothetical protein